MAMRVWVTAGMAILALLLAITFWLVARRGVETSNVWPVLYAAATILAASLLLASGRQAIGFRRAALLPIATEPHDVLSELAEEIRRRQEAEHALEKLTQRERLLAAAMESASYPIIITKSLDGTITDWNSAAERLYRYSSTEAIGNNIEIIVPSDRRDEHSTIFAKSAIDMSVENFETVRIAKDGRRIEVSISIRPVKSAAGEVVGMAKITRDITAQKSAEEKFRMAVEACPSGMLMIDGSGTVVMVNTEIERLFGYRRDELVGQSVDMLVPARLRNQHAQYRTDFIRLPEAHRMAADRELTGLRKDKTEFPLEVVLNPIQTADGVLILGVIVDISERKRLERSKEDFVATVSHELRTPLTSISGSLGLLIGGATGELPDSAARLLRIAQTSSQRLVRLVNDILDIEKMEASQVVFDFKRVDVRALLESAIEAIRGFADAYHVQIRLDEDSAFAEVLADPDRFSQVITNLLSNAIKFSLPDNEVVVAVARRGGLVRISVRDHGSGIPADFRPHMFEKFAQAEASDARRKGGTGLGLSIVKQIVLRLRGAVSFEDAAGGGTVFYVDLPGWDQVIERSIDPNLPLSVARILLCEDDPNVAVALRQGLQQLGWATDLAHTREDTIRLAGAASYCAILVDLQLPDCDVMDLIRELGDQRRIIAMSADVSRDKSRLAAFVPGVPNCIAKPVDIGELEEMLERVEVEDARGELQVLHVDDDPDVLAAVARAFGASATVVSVNSIGDARRALATHAGRFDLAVLDLELGSASGLDLLPDLHGSDGRVIPVIVFSSRTENLMHDPQIKASLSKSRDALNSLVAAAHDRLLPRIEAPSKEVA